MNNDIIKSTGVVFEKQITIVNPLVPVIIGLRYHKPKGENSMLKKKGKSTKFISAALAAIIASFSAMSAFSVASAQENQVGTIHCIDEQYVDPALVEAVADCVENCETMADVSDLNVQTSQLSYLINVLKNNYPQLFYFSGFNFMISGGRIVAISNALFLSGEEYLAQIKSLCGPWLSVSEIIPVPAS